MSSSGGKGKKRKKSEEDVRSVKKFKESFDDIVVNTQLPGVTKKASEYDIHSFEQSSFDFKAKLFSEVDSDDDVIWIKTDQAVPYIPDESENVDDVDLMTNNGHDFYMTSLKTCTEIGPGDFVNVEELIEISEGYTLPQLPTDDADDEDRQLDKYNNINVDVIIFKETSETDILHVDNDPGEFGDIIECEVNAKNIQNTKGSANETNSGDEDGENNNAFINTHQNYDDMIFEENEVEISGPYYIEYNDDDDDDAVAYSNFRSRQWLFYSMPCRGL